MSQPIKFVEDSNLSPAKTPYLYNQNNSNQTQNYSLFSSINSNLINNSTISFSSPLIQKYKYSDFSSPTNLSIFNNESFSKVKDIKNHEDESTMNLNESNIKKTRKNSLNSIVGEIEEEPIENNNNNSLDNNIIHRDDTMIKSRNFLEMNIIKNWNNSNLNSYFDNKENDCKESKSFNTCQLFKQLKYDKEDLNLNKEDNKNNINDNNKNLRFREISQYFKEMKELSDKIVQTLELMYAKNEFLLNISDKKNNEINDEQNNEKMDKKKSKKTEINMTLEQEHDEFEEEKSKINNNIYNNNLQSLYQKKNNNYQYFDFLNQSQNQTNSIKNIMDDNNNNSSIHNKIKSLKRINSRKFNIKSRGLRYNILTEEMKKQLLLDAMNMRTAEVAKKYGISTRNVNRWKKKGIERKKGSGRKFKDPRLERKILEWYKMQDKESLTSKQFKEKAMELSENKTFRASSGWLTNMKRKYNLIFKKY